jgi:hypothetical protein
MGRINFDFYGQIGKLESTDIVKSEFLDYKARTVDKVF